MKIYFSLLAVPIFDILNGGIFIFKIIGVEWRRLHKSSYSFQKNNVRKKLFYTHMITLTDILPTFLPISPQIPSILFIILIILLGAL